MRKLWLFGLLMVLLLVGCSRTKLAPADDVAAQGNEVSWTSNSASVEFSSDDGACVYTTVTVGAAQGTARNIVTGPFSWAFVSISRYDYCADEYLLSASGFATDLAGGELSVNKFSSATFRRTFELYDFVSGGYLDVDIDLTWKGQGKVSHDRTRSRDTFSGYTRKSRTDDASRDAKVMGSVSDGITDFTPGLIGSGTLRQASESIKQRSAPVIEAFGSFPTGILPGESTFLFWFVWGTQPMTLTIDQGIGDVSGKNYAIVSPTTTTSYTLTATNKDGSSTASRTIWVIEADELEPNNSPESAMPVALDYASPGLTITAGDVDWFAFSLTEAATVVADIDAQVHGSFLDSALGLFDDELNQIAYNDIVCNDDDWFCSLDAYLEVHLEPGSYYLAVSGYPDYDFTGAHAQSGFYFLKATASP
jgi:hypothetical protein